MATSATFDRVKALVLSREILVSNHGYDELEADDILPRDVFDGIANGSVVEDYPTAAKGPSVLVLQRDREGRPVHVVWGIAAGTERPAVLVTAYRPDLKVWSADFLERRKK